VSRVLLDTDDLDEHFAKQLMDIEDLLKLANTLVRQYFTATAYERAMYSNNGHTREPFMNGSLWDVPTMDSDTESSRELSGDQILANGLLRMRDEMLHYEFHHSISNGDIGRALNVMAVSTIYIMSVSVELTIVRYGHSHSPA